MVLSGEDLNVSSFTTHQLHKMPQIQAKIQPNMRTQPTVGTMSTKTTTAATLPTQQGGIGNTLRNTLTSIFQGIYNYLSSWGKSITYSPQQQRQQLGAVGMITGTPPPTTKQQPKSNQQFFTTYLSPLSTSVTTPMVAPQFQQKEPTEEEKKQGVKSLAKALAEEPKNLTAESLKTLSTYSQNVIGTVGQMYAPLKEQTGGLLKTIGTELPTKSGTTTGTATGTDIGIDITQSPFAQDIQKLTTTTPPQTTTQTVSNVPQGADVQIFKDPTGGSTPFFGYVIKPGDNLSKIAQTYGTSVEDILRLNKDKTDAIKNIPGRPLGDIIIAGKEIRIPVVQKDIKQPGLLGKNLKTAEQINNAAKEQIQSPQPQLTEQSLSELINKNFQENIQSFENAYNQYVQLADVNNYSQQYETFTNQLGISDTMAQLKNIENVMANTKDDIMKEAAAAGGLVTESQVSEVLNFREEILKQQYSALTDLLNEKEKMLDKMMTYSRWDREELEKMLDRELRIKEFEANYMKNVFGQEWNVMKYIQDRNRKMIEQEAKIGTLHTASPDYLAKLVDPMDPLYTGLDLDELNLWIQYSQRITQEKELNRQKILQQLQIQKSREAREAKKAETEKKTKSSNTIDLESIFSQ